MKEESEISKIELIYTALQEAKRLIELAYKPEGKPYGHPDSDITDEKIRSYYYEINEMCCELADRNVMPWQKD